MADIQTKTTNGHSKHPPEARPLVSPDAMMSLEQAREEISYALGLEAYLWGFPLYSHCNALTDWLKAGAIGLNTLRRYTRPGDGIAGYGVPDDATIASYAMFDVTREPVVIHVPYLQDPRWYLVQIDDTFDEVIANIGGMKGPRPGDFVITGPGFAGAAPAEMTRIASRTRMGIVTVRIAVAGDFDHGAALAAQRGFHVLPLSTYLRDGLGYPPPKPAPVREPALRGPADLLFFEILGHALQSYLPDTTDSLVAAFRAIGLTPGAGFDWRELDPTTLRGLSRAAKAASQIIDQTWEAAGELTNGWRYILASGRTGHDLALRAALAKHASGTELAAEVIAARLRIDAADDALTGEHKYTLDFPAGQLPPVAAFWNLALHGEDMRFVENAIGRYSLGSMSDRLRVTGDGSLRILIQHERPAEVTNWLPAPAGPFTLTMRMAGPASPLLDGSYRLPAVRRTV